MSREGAAEFSQSYTPEINNVVLNCNNISSNNPMAASYTEIAFQSNCTVKDNTNLAKKRIDVIPRDLTCLNSEEINNIVIKNTGCQPQSRPVSLLYDKNVSCSVDGPLQRDGEVKHFVVEDLEYKIKLSSPITKREINQTSASSRNSTPSTSCGHLPKNLLQSYLAQIGSTVLNDIEVDAHYLAASVDNLTENLYNLLHSVSSITVDNVEVHKNSVNKLTDNIDANIKCMYTIMAKTEEISKSMKPSEQLALRIRELKRLIDMLESNL